MSTILYSGIGVSVAPCKDVNCDSLSRSFQNDLAIWQRLGVRKVRMILTSEAFTQSPQRVFDGAIAPYVEACLSLKIQPTACLYSSAEMGWRDRNLAQTNKGRVQLAERTAELVRLGVQRYKDLRYDLSNENVLYNPELADWGNENACLKQDHLNSLHVCYARKFSSTAHVTISCPVWGSADQAPNLTWFGDRYTSIGCDYYMYPGLTCDRWPNEGDMTQRAIERLRPFADTLRRLGTSGVIREWGDANLHVRNDAVTTRVLLAQLNAIRLFGLERDAFIWTGPSVTKNGAGIPLAATPSLSA